MAGLPQAEVPTAILPKGPGEVSVYTFFYAAKPNTRGRDGQRAVILTQAFLWMVNMHGEVVKLMPLNALEMVMYDSRKNRVGFYGNDLVQDWVLDYQVHRHNEPNTMSAALHAINVMRKKLETIDDDLPTEEGKISSAFPNDKPNQQNAVALLRLYEKRPTLIPRLKHGEREELLFQSLDVAADETAERFKGQRSKVYYVHLGPADESLGIGFLHDVSSEDASERSSQSSTTPIVRVAEVLPGSPAARAGLPAGEMLSINGKRVYSVEDVHAIVTRARAAGDKMLSIKAIASPEIGMSIYRVPSNASSLIVPERFTLPPLVHPSTRKEQMSDFCIPISPELIGTQHYDYDAMKDPVVNGSRAVLISVSYYSTPGLRLPGSSQRLYVMSEFLQRKGYLQQIHLTDDPTVEFNNKSPSLVRHSGARRSDIIKALEDLTAGITAGENLFVYIAGLGPNSRVLDDDAECQGLSDISFYSADMTHCVTCQDLGAASQRAVNAGCKLFMFADFHFGGSACAMPQKIELVVTGDPIESTLPPEMMTYIHPGPGRAYALSTLSKESDASLLKIGMATNAFIRSVGGGKMLETTVQARRNPSMLHLLTGIMICNVPLYPPISPQECVMASVKTTQESRRRWFRC